MTVLKCRIMGLPAELRLYPKDIEGPPNVIPLQEALAARPREPGSMIELSEVMFAVTSALPEAHISPAFGAVYASLTRNIGHGIAHPGKYTNTKLGRFRQPDELMVQGHNFADTWFDPLGPVVEYRLGRITLRQAIAKMGLPWAFGMLDPEMQLAEPPDAFMDGGMLQHIRNPKDLKKSLRVTGVSRDYLRWRPRGDERGDYFKTDDWIDYTAHQMLPDLVPGHLANGMARSLGPIVGLIKFMRLQTCIEYNQSLRQTDAQRANSDAVGELRAFRLAKTLHTNSAIGLNGISLATTGRRWQSSRLGTLEKTA